MHDEGTLIYVRLAERIKPIDRGDRYEIPLDEALDELGLGQVTDGGTMLEHSGEIAYVDLQITLHDLEKGIPFVCRFLEERGAPKGSLLSFRDREDAKMEIPFGRTEGIAIYFDGVNLSDEEYRDCDTNVVWEEFSRRLGSEGEIRGHWQGTTETAFYIYGKSASKMRSLLAEYMNSYPLCRGARVVSDNARRRGLTTQISQADSALMAPRAWAQPKECCPRHLTPAAPSRARTARRSSFGA